MRFRRGAELFHLSPPFEWAGKCPLSLLYPFRFFDPARGRWIRARYLAEGHEIEARYRQ